MKLASLWTGEASALHGQTGVVVEVQEGKFMVRLASGLKLGPMSACSMTKQQRAQASSADTLQPQGPEQQNEVYAPFTQGASESRVQAQAARLKTALEKSSCIVDHYTIMGAAFLASSQERKRSLRLGDSCEDHFGQSWLFWTEHPKSP